MVRKSNQVCGGFEAFVPTIICHFGNSIKPEVAKRVLNSNLFLLDLVKLMQITQRSL